MTKSTSWETLETNEINDGDNDGYTTSFSHSTTLKHPNRDGDNTVFKIDFTQNNNKSDQLTDKAIYMFTKDGWTLIATDKNIPLRFPDSKEGLPPEFMLDSLKDTCRNWVEDGKKYIEKIMDQKGEKDG